MHSIIWILRGIGSCSRRVRFGALLCLPALGITGCGGGGGGGDKTPTGNAGPGPATRLAIRTQPAGATVGSALQSQPVVELQTATGAVATTTSAVVSARLSSGTGSLTGATTATTVNGVATFSGLGITGAVGPKVLEFSAPGLGVVLANAVTLATGPAKALAITTPASATVMVTVPLATQPVLQAVDEAGNPAPFAGTVTAAVDSGTGAIASGATANTDASGRATFVNLTLGALSGDVGQARLRMSAPGLDAASFRVTLSCYSQSIALATVVASAMSVSDCSGGSGSLFRTYSMARTAAVSHLRLTVNSAFQPTAYFRGPGAPNTYWGTGAAAGATTATLDILTPAGTTYFWPRPALPGVTGAYNLRVDPLAGDVQCTVVHAGGTMSTVQQLSAGDCMELGYLGDFYYVGLTSGAAVAATVTTTAFAPYVSIWRNSPFERLAFATGATSATTSFFNTGSSSLVYVYVSSQAAGGTGAYTLNLTVAHPTQTALAASQRSTGPALLVLPPGASRADLESRVRRDAIARP